VLSPRLAEVGRHPGIDIFKNSTLVDFNGTPGNFTARVSRQRKSTDACGNGSDRGTWEKTLAVGAVIFSAGSSVSDPSGLDEFYLYGRRPNVLTSLEFERLLNPEGPTRGRVVRPSDNRVPERIAWLQCVGSRTAQRCGHAYCSSVCCMTAVKQVMSVRNTATVRSECTVFYQDMRTVGKDGERFLQQAQSDNGIRFVRSAVHTIVDVPGSGDVRLRYMDESGNIVEETFQMVVLSVGLETSTSVRQAANCLGIQLNSDRFVDVDELMPAATSRPGVFACGTVVGPMDISGSVTTADAAVCLARIALADADRTCPEEQEVFTEETIPCLEATPRVGVFVCSCGTNIGGVVDVHALREYAADLGTVYHADVQMFSCSREARAGIQEAIRRHGLNRIVMAACSPKTHEPLFRKMIMECGLNPALLEMANIRNHSAWVHAETPGAALEKSKTLVRMAVARAAQLKSISQKSIDICPRALVIGAGVAGLNAALCLGNMGFDVDLLEREAQPGGMALKVWRTLGGNRVPQYMKKLVDQVARHEKIRLHTRTRLIGFEGFKGNFTARVESDVPHSSMEIQCGAVIAATGAEPYEPCEYGYGTDDRLITQLQLEQMLRHDNIDSASCIVMIQCAGSRNGKVNYCSRICCRQALKNALTLTETYPGIQVYILYRDIRVYGRDEDYYTRARRRGVIFVRFDPDRPPDVQTGGNCPTVRVYDPVLKKDLMIPADWVALSTGMVPRNTTFLETLMKLSTDLDGFLFSPDSRFRPVESSRDGVFFCGSACGPCRISESICQARAAASKAAGLLALKRFHVSAATAVVDADRCIRCMTCVRVCPNHAANYDPEEGRMVITDADCRGCGICVGACPRNAVELNGRESRLIMTQIDALMEMDR